METTDNGHDPSVHITACRFCHGDMQGQRVCPWCGYDPTERKMVENYTFPFKKPDLIQLGWPEKCKLPFDKALLIILICAALSVVLYSSLPTLLSTVFLTIQLPFIFFIACVIVFSTLTSVAGKTVKNLITTLGRSNSAIWGVVSILIILVPTYISLIVVLNFKQYNLWGIISIVFIILSIIFEIAEIEESISSYKFCRNCMKPLSLGSHTYAIHSSNTEALIEATKEGKGPEVLDLFQLPVSNKAAITAIRLHFCRKCKQGFLEFKQQRICVKKVKGKQKNYKIEQQTVAYVPVEGLLLEKWNPPLNTK
jgi:hypothetical protein